MNQSTDRPLALTLPDDRVFGIAIVADASMSANACECDGLGLVKRSIVSCASIAAGWSAPNFRVKLWAKV